jgi:hypothetical protein
MFQLNSSLQQYYDPGVDSEPTTDMSTGNVPTFRNVLEPTASPSYDKTLPRIYGSSTAHNPLGLLDLSQGELCFPLLEY